MPVPRHRYIILKKYFTRNGARAAFRDAIFDASFEKSRVLPLVYSLVR
jgi:hypothetical protein